MRIFAAVFVAFALHSLGAGAAPPCAANPHRQFDFWIGDWTVSRADNGQFAGENRIEPVLDGCALHESWTGTKGYRGNSYNAYDPTRGVWHQTWVDSSGGLLVLEGKLESGKMVLEGQAKQADGKTVLNRITWTPLDGGKVRQRWDSTADGGKTWQVQFDGIYAKRANGSSSGGGGGGSPLALRRDI